VLTYTWRQVSGPPGTFENPHAVVTRFLAPELPEATPSQTYLFELTVDQDPPGDRSEPLYLEVQQFGAAAAGGGTGGFRGVTGGGSGGCRAMPGGQPFGALPLVLVTAGLLLARRRRGGPPPA
jgi:hypothetical protein